MAEFVLPKVTLVRLPFSCLWFLPQVCEKDGFHMSWAVKLVEQICRVFSTETEKHFFIQQLENTFSQVTREVFEHSAAGERAFGGVLFSLY